MDGELFLTKTTIISIVLDYLNPDDHHHPKVYLLEVLVGLLKQYRMAGRLNIMRTMDGLISIQVCYLEIVTLQRPSGAMHQNTNLRF